MRTTSSDGDLVLFEKGAGIARITINRAAKRNALSLATISQLGERLRQAEQDFQHKDRSAYRRRR